jgi:hypothetical protein
MQAFTPGAVLTVNLAVTATTGNVAIVGSSNQLLLTNAGGNDCFIELGTASTQEAATTTGMPVLARDKILITRNLDQDYIAAICASGQTTTLYITPGEGI